MSKKTGNNLPLLRKSVYLIFLASLIAAHPATSQNISVAASVDQTTIGTQDILTYTIEFSGKSLPEIETPEAPSAEGLVLMRPFPSTSRNVSIIQGSMSQSLSYSWSYQAVQEGTARIFAASIVVGGATMRTKEIEISVVPQSQRPARPRQPNIFDPFGLNDDAVQPEREIDGQDVFIRAVPTKRTAYVNEQLTIEYQLFFRTGIQLRQSRLADSWDAEGFWREELDVESRPIPTTVVENGLRYNKITLKRVAVFPTRSGVLTIDPLKIESEAALPGSGGFFSVRRSRYQPITINSSTVRINVEPLPENQPNDFNGGVGNLDLVVAVTPTEVELGKSIDLTIRLRGEGNISTLEPPEFKLPGVFEVYDPEISADVDRSRSFVSGTKEFKYVLVPRANGAYTLPPIRYSYFDTSEDQFVTLSSEPSSVIVSGLAAPEVAALATTSGLPVDDISGRHFLQANWSKIKTATLHTSPIAAGVLVIPLLLLAGIFAYVRRTDAMAADQVLARSKMAHPLAKKHLRKAAKLLEQNDSRGYYAELERAVGSFVGNKLNIGEKGYTRHELAQRLEQAGASTDSVSRFKSLMSECEMAQFSPNQPSLETLRTAGDRAAEIIIKLHGELSTK